MSGVRREDLVRLWQELEAKYVTANLGNLVSVDLGRHYETLSGEDRIVFESLLIERINSDDPGERFTALAVVDDQEVLAALPVLRRELAALRDAVGPSVPFDRAKLERMVSKLERAASEESG